MDLSKSTTPTFGQVGLGALVTATLTEADAPSGPALDRYKGKWLTLSNTTLGMLMATIDGSIVLICLPDILRGIELNPLRPGTTSYVLLAINGLHACDRRTGGEFGPLGGHCRPGSACTTWGLRSLRFSQSAYP